MSKYDYIKTLPEDEFRRLTGVKKETFKVMVSLLLEAEKTKKKSGTPHKLCIEDRLLLTLEYLREYGTYFHIAKRYQIHETTAMRISKKVEDILIKSGKFSLPGRKALLKSGVKYEIILIDATESPCERPKKKRFKNKKRIKNRNNKQKHFYSGKKNRHTQKIQVAIEKETRIVICLSFSNGKKHDLRLLKESGVVFKSETMVIADSGYQGLQDIHLNTVLPKKKGKNKSLSKADKKNNTKIASQRAANEHAIGHIKRFRITSERYRNRRKRFGLRFNLIAGICNYELINNYEKNNLQLCDYELNNYELCNNKLNNYELHTNELNSYELSNLQL